MENHLLDEMEREYAFTDQEIFTKIWTRPRAVLYYIHDLKYEKFVVPLLVLAGVAGAFDRAVDRNLGDSLPLIGLIITCLISGALFGWLSYYVFAKYPYTTCMYNALESDSKLPFALYSL